MLFAEDGTVQTPEGFPVLQFVSGRFWANNHTYILQGTAVSTQYLYLAACHYPIAGYITGAAQPKITQGNLNRLPIRVADRCVQASFDELVDPLLDSWQTARGHVRQLAATRDLLLPRLVTGRLDISDMDLDEIRPTEAA